MQPNFQTTRVIRLTVDVGVENFGFREAEGFRRELSATFPRDGESEVT